MKNMAYNHCGLKINGYFCNVRLMLKALMG